MDSIIAAEIARLQNMTVTSLAEKFETLIGEKFRSRNKRYLIRRIAWRLQANAEGGLSERALKRDAELALDSEVRVTPPKHSKSSQAIIVAAASTPVRDSRLPPNGSFLYREYKGKPIRELVMEDAFEYEGQVFQTLTAMANAITGSHVNGFQFLKLGNKK